MGDNGKHDGLVTCEGCGKRYAWKSDLAGKRLQCGCGAVIVVPQRITVLEGVYDLLEGDAHDAPPLPKVGAEVAEIKAAGRGNRAGAGHADGGRPDAAAIAERLGIALPTRKRVDYTADVKAGREELEQLARGSLLRNVIVPVPIIFGGLILSFVQARFWDGPGEPTDAQAVGVVAVRAALSVLLMLFTMFVLTRLTDVNFMGSFQSCILRLCAIAIGPSAVYASLMHMVGGELGGPLAGAVASVVLYGVLFWALMRVDLKDAAVCTIVTFGVVMMANYLAFRFEGILRGSDI